MQECSLCGKEDLLGHETVTICKDCATKHYCTQPASTNTASREIAPWNELVESFTKSIPHIIDADVRANFFAGAKVFHEFITGQLQA